VLDLSSVIMGPLATRILADFGASVIKIEPPEGDVMRFALPARNHGMGALFMHLNRGKRSVVLDLKTEAGRDALLRLCVRSDVFIHNTRLAALARLGLGYADVARANPAIVYVSLVGYGQRGPGAALQAYDDLIQGTSGLASLFALEGGEPRYVPSTIADRIGGLSAVNVVLAALLHRTQSGKGQAIEVPMFETLADIVLGDHLGGESFVPAEGPMGYARLLTAMRRPYRTLDGYLCVLVYNEGQWTRFFEVSGNVERYRSDARLNQSEQRRRDYHYAYAAVAEVLATRTCPRRLSKSSKRSCTIRSSSRPVSCASASIRPKDAFGRSASPRLGARRSLHPREMRRRSASTRMKSCANRRVRRLQRRACRGSRTTKCEPPKKAIVPP
jgi:crotonobetainyl-CoA:carnitine CoA-transferase CaiB-like acyl-CoA transferase